MFGGSAAATTVARRACTPRLGDPRPTRNARSGPPRPPRGDDVDADVCPARDDEPRAAAAAVEAREPVTTDAARRAGGRGVPGIARGATAARMFPPRAPHTGILRARASLGEGQARDGVSVLASQPDGHFSKLLAFSDPVSRDRAQLRSEKVRKKSEKVRTPVRTENAPPSLLLKIAMGIVAGCKTPDARKSYWSQSAFFF